MNYPKLSVIILTYNRVNDLIALLENLRQQTITDFETIVIDNNSTDSTKYEVTINFPEVKYFKSYYNSGVPGGRNFGIANSTGQYLVFIDNDAEIEKTCLEKVVNIFDNEPKAGILTFKILNYFTKELDMTCWVLDKELMKEEKNCPVNTFVGAGFAIRRAVIDEIGLLWDHLFFMHEEKEYSMRLLHTNYNIYYAPQLIVYHKVSEEKRYSSNERFYYYGIRNEFWTYFRNVPFWPALRHLIKLAFLAMLYSLRKGYFIFYIKGILQGIFFSKVAIRLRNPISKEKYAQYQCLLNKKPDRIYVRIKRFITFKQD